MYALLRRRRDALGFTSEDGLSSTSWFERKMAHYGKMVTILTRSTEFLWYTVAGTRKQKVIVTRDPSGRLNDCAYFSTETGLSDE